MRPAAALICVLLLAVPAVASDASAKYFGGLSLIDQDGKQVALYDLMRDRTVVLSTFFSSCTSACPVMSRNLFAVQEKYAERMGKDLVFISITVDPANDTPAKLKSYAKSVGAKQGWYFLTGSKEQVESALRKIGQYTASPSDHMNVFAAGNDKTGLWKKFLGLAKPDEIVAGVGTVLND